MHKDDTVKIRDLFSAEEGALPVIMVTYDISDREQMNGFRFFLVEKLRFSPVQDSVYCSGDFDDVCYRSLISYVKTNLQPADGEYVDVRILKFHPSNILTEVIWGNG